MNDVSEYTIDLNLPERERWREVIAREGNAARAVADEAKGMLPRIAPLIAPLFARGHRRAGAWYRGEMEAWTEPLGVSMGRMTLLQHLYELSHFNLRGVAANIFGCTAGVRWFDDLGMVHVRTLDWPLQSVAGATRIFRFRSGEREFVSVGIAGFVGVLSGMVPGAYSVTINWAPAAQSPRLRYPGPAFLLRRVLETCGTFEEAVRELSRTRISTSVIYTVCGARRGEAWVIERTGSGHAFRTAPDDQVVAATNHFLAHPLNESNCAKDEEFIAGSTERFNTMRGGLGDVTLARDAVSVGAILGQVENEFTCHKIVFIPATGTVAMWPAADSA